MTTRIGAAKCLIRDPSGAVLTLRRSGTHPYVPFSYDIPGGKIESGETPRAGACREVLEEAGIAIPEDELVEIDHRQLDDHFGKNYDLYFYEWRTTTVPAIRLSFEHDEYRWVPLAELDVLENPAYMAMIDAYRT